MCDGQVVNDCDIISLVEYESTLKEQLRNIEFKIGEIADEIMQVLGGKKAALIEMYRKDPRSRNDTFINMRKIIKQLDSINVEDVSRLDIAKTITNPLKTDSKPIQCRIFSDHNLNVFISRSLRILNYMGGSQWGYAFLKQPKKVNYKVLKWTLRVPKCNFHIGKVTHFLFTVFYTIITEYELQYIL